MFGPIRSLYAIGRKPATAVLLSMAASTAMFAATPFVLAPISEAFAVPAGTAGLVSVAQVGAFAIANLVLPRLVAPGPLLYRIAVAVFVVSGPLGLVAPSFAAFLAVRACAGAAAGALTWVAWADAMRFERSMARVSAAGPVTALVAAPVFAMLASSSALEGVYWALTVIGVPALLASPGDAVTTRVRGRSRSRSNRVLLGALALLTMSGAALFVFEALAASRLYGLSSVETSLGFSANAAAGFLGAKLASRHRVPGRWMASIAPAAFLTLAGGSPAFFYLGMAWWGFAFWMAIPGVLSMLAERSLARDERAGDAQGLMAIGRSIGPAVGGVFVDQGSFLGLAAAASVGMGLAGVVVMGVQEGRERLPVTDPRIVA